MGVPARYVSGYWNQPGELATHAWCQVWAGEDVGWVDVDPTHNTFVGDHHVTTAVGRDYNDVPPNRGLWKGRGAEESMSVAVKVEPVDRVPLEWNDWNAPVFRPFDRMGFAASGRSGGMRQSQRSRAAYPNQRGDRAGLHQQQGEQQ
jgi:transglutaminase-like putative cysteine protease